MTIRMTRGDRHETVLPDAGAGQLAARAQRPRAEDNEGEGADRVNGLGDEEARGRLAEASVGDAGRGAQLVGEPRGQPGRAQSERRQREGDGRRERDPARQRGSGLGDVGSGYVEFARHEDAVRVERVVGERAADLEAVARVERAGRFEESCDPVSRLIRRYPRRARLGHDVVEQRGARGRDPRCSALVRIDLSSPCSGRAA